MSDYKSVDKKWKIAAIVSMLCLLLVIPVFLFVFIREGYPERIINKITGNIDYQPSAREDYTFSGWARSMDDFLADIVFLGDSITYGGEWSVYFPDKSVCAISVPGDGVQEISYKVDIAKKLHPKKVFILAGVNDVSKDGFEKILTVDYKDIVVSLQKEGIEVYIQSILPVCEPSKVDNDRIIRANEILRQISQECKCTYIDIREPYTDENGRMKSELSKDGIHLKPESYQHWIEILEPYVG